MSRYSNTLCNPTPFPVNLEWQAGQFITIAPFDQVELTIAQVQDFKSDTPGSEAVKELVAPLGIFLLDPSQSYDYQALKAIREAVKEKQNRYDAALERTISRRSAQGMAFNNEDEAKQFLEVHGYGVLLHEIEALKNIAFELEKVVADEPEITGVNALDPERTVFVLDPPRQFATKTQMEIFLNFPGNEEIKKEHEKLFKKMQTPVTKTKTKAEANA